MELDPDAMEWCQQGHTLSNDIWKKFELIPTPPRSPPRDTDFDLGSLPEDLRLSQIDLPLLEGDELDVDLDLEMDLDAYLPNDLAGCDPVGLPCAHSLSSGTCSTCTQLTRIGSELRHDCMWIGTCTADAHTHYHTQMRTHNDSCSHFTDLFMDNSSSGIDTSAFTNLSDLACPGDDTNEDADTHIDDEPESSLHSLSQHVTRPDTPSESSETDTDEDVREFDDDDEDENTPRVFPQLPQPQYLGFVHRDDEVPSLSRETPSTSGMVHIDHSYHCMRIPSPEPANTTSSATVSPRQRHTHSSLLHTPSDSEDEIDVVSVGSPSSTYSSTSTNSNKNNIRSKKRQNGPQIIASSNDSMKVVKVRTGSLPSNPTRRVRKQLQQAMAAEVKRCGASGSMTTSTSSSGHTTILRRTGGSSPLKTPKRLHQRGSGSRKRGSPRSDSDDPEKRQIHNSLERMRRVGLRNAFDNLRCRVPELRERDKAPKVEILNRAAEYCNSIKELEHHLEQEKERLKKHGIELRKRLHAIQRQAQ